MLSLAGAGHVVPLVELAVWAMRYIDPLRLCTFDLPIGWVLDIASSSAKQLQFRWWRDSGELLGVQGLHAIASPEQTDEEWFSQLSRLVQPGSPRPLTFLRLGGRAVAVAEVEAASDETYQRSVYVRGRCLALGIQHRARVRRVATRPPDLAVLSSLFRRVLESLTLPADSTEPRLHSFEEVARIQEEARAAWQLNDPRSTAELLQQQLMASTETFLWSVARGHEIPGAVLLFAAEALLSLSNLGVKPELLRAAKEVVGRARAIGAEGVEDLASAIRAAEIERIEETPLDDFGVHRALAHWAMRQAIARGKAGEVSEMESLLCDAVDDFLAALTSESMTVRVNPEVSATLERQDLSREQIGSAVAGFERSEVLNGLAEAVGRLKDLSFRGGDSGYEHELTSMMVDIADERVTVPTIGETPIRMISTDALTSVIEARIAHAYSLLSLGDASSVAGARETMGEAEASLAKMEAAQEPTTALAFVPAEKKAELRASVSVLAAKLACHVGDMSEVFSRVTRGEEAVTAMLDNSLRASLTSELQELRALALGQFPEQRERSAQSMTAEDGPYDRLRRSFDISNRVGAAVNAGDIERALTLGAEGLTLALSVSPFHQYVPELLLNIALGLDRRMSGQASAIAGGTNRESIPLYDAAVWAVCLDAAAGVLDARRVLTQNREAKLSLVETELARRISDAMIEMYAFRLPFPEMAIATAERFRGRTLEMEIRARRRTAPRATVVIDPAPALDSSDPQAAIATAAQYVSDQTKALFAAAGEVPGIAHDEVAATVREIGTPVLILQPIGSTVALLGLAANGEPSCVKSPVPIEEWNAAAKMLVSRLASLSREEPTAAIERQSPGRVLWDAMFEPMKHLVEDGGALIVIPHRDLALIPFGLLRHADGRTATERFQLSLSPSLGMLRLLRGRGSFERQLPHKVVLFGDPDLDRAQARRFDPLPQARAEVEIIRETLVDAGVDETSIAVSVGADASEAQYRKVAAHADLVHLACHAFLPRNLSAEMSYLVLASEPPLDGLLLASEVPDIPLDDALVFLSACESGRGQPSMDGVLGLGRAFLEAGARAVVMSYFRVNDSVARVFAAHFYEALLDRIACRDSAGALHEAATRTRRDLEAGNVEGVVAHAAHWGAFAVVGDAGGVCYRPGR